MITDINRFPTKIQENITFSWESKPRKAKFVPFPVEISPRITNIFHRLGITQLYKHQAKSINSILSGKNIILSTGTASGKSLCFQLPILKAIYENSCATSLLLFPTKALTGDQFKNLQNLISILKEDNPEQTQNAYISMYDGDTSYPSRVSIRNKVNILLTNPDMLHIGILPHHPSWERFFTNLKYVVIDEIHSYRGVFGSHFANVIRRLRRITDHYQSEPQYIMTSATISNPKEFTEKLVDKKFTLISQDSSRQNRRSYVLYNPPIVDSDLGIRQNMHSEALKISKFLLDNEMQTIVFARTRRSVERFFKKLSEFLKNTNYEISAYRSGFLKKERREIESGLKSGDIDLVISTTALELGIDMGFVDAILLMGYPGSISRYLQQSGRAGRNEEESLSIMVASSYPVDQFIIKHPEFIKEKHPEKVLINPDNPFILINHLKCATFELPFDKEYKFGSLKPPSISELLDLLKQAGLLYKDAGRFYWKSTHYPANEISLRSIAGNPFQLLLDENGKSIVIGELDQQSIKKFTHPGAIYLHNGHPFLVEDLDIGNNDVHLSESNVPYYTDPIINIDVSIEKVIYQETTKAFNKGFGDIILNEEVVGYKKISWETNYVIDQEGLDLESDELLTTGFWITLPDHVINQIKALNLWTNEKNKYGRDWKHIRTQIINRDKSKCQLCGVEFPSPKLHIHHKKPFRQFIDPLEANQPGNLITLCPRCHRIAERSIKMRSVLNGFGYGFQNIAPVYLNCDVQDLGYTFNEKIGQLVEGPGILIYDQFPGGIGLSEYLFHICEDILSALNDHILLCPCKDGCPSCVGPPGEDGIGAKKGTTELLKQILN